MPDQITADKEKLSDRLEGWLEGEQPKTLGNLIELCGKGWEVEKKMGQTVVKVGNFTYANTGWRTIGDALLANLGVSRKLVRHVR